MAQKAGTPPLAVLADDSGVPLPANATNGLSVKSEASTTGGWSKSRIDGLSTTVTPVKSSAAGTLAGWFIYNPAAAVTYVQVFDVATAGGVTLGTTAPNVVLGIPPGSAANLLNNVGIAFANGIQVAATTGPDNAVAPATAAEPTFFYK